MIYPVGVNNEPASEHFFCLTYTAIILLDYHKVISDLKYHLSNKMCCVEDKH